MYLFLIVGSKAFHSLRQGVRVTHEKRLRLRNSKSPLLKRLKPYQGRPSSLTCLYISRCSKLISSTKRRCDIWEATVKLLVEKEFTAAPHIMSSGTLDAVHMQVFHSPKGAFRFSTA